jgi:hypothetical protein
MKENAFVNRTQKAELKLRVQSSECRIEGQSRRPEVQNADNSEGFGI